MGQYKEAAPDPKLRTVCRLLLVFAIFVRAMASTARRSLNIPQIDNYNGSTSK
jgi:hypothetical protein